MFLHLATFLEFLLMFTLNTILFKVFSWRQNISGAAHVVCGHGFEKQSASDTVASCHLDD